MSIFIEFKKPRIKSLKVLLISFTNIYFLEKSILFLMYPKMITLYCQNNLVIKCKIHYKNFQSVLVNTTTDILRRIITQLMYLSYTCNNFTLLFFNAELHLDKLNHKVWKYIKYMAETNGSGQLFMVKCLLHYVQKC